MHARRCPLHAAVAACLAAATASPPALAWECAGADPLELVVGCSVRLDNADFSIRLHAPAGAELGTADGVREALDRALVFLHGYAVVDPVLPWVRYEDGRPGNLADLLDAGVSVVAMAPGDADADAVEDDAEAARHALALLSAYRRDTALPWVVLGHSMGGLVARLALARADADGVAHGVALYVSYDAPHGGVNVPQGMQHLKLAVDAWAAMTEADFVAIDSGWEGVFEAASVLGITTALDPETVGGFPDPTSLQAQQMTVQAVAHPEAYPAFMALLDEAGFPAVRSIAVSNGNTRAVPNTQAVPPGGELFYFTGAKGNSAASVRGTFTVFTDSPDAPALTSHVYYDGFLRNHDGGRKDARTPGDVVLMDHLSGGTLDYAAKMLAAASAARGDFHRPTFRGAADSAIPFVPTSSALGLPVGTPDEDLAAIVAAGGTPFDVVIAIGDLPAFAANVDHDLLVLTDALLAEIHALLPCREGVDRLGCVDEPGDSDGDDTGACGPSERPVPGGGCEPLDGDGTDGCGCSASGPPAAGGLWLALLGVGAARRRRPRA